MGGSGPWIRPFLLAIRKSALDHAVNNPDGDSEQMRTTHRHSVRVIDGLLAYNVADSADVEWESVEDNIVGFLTGLRHLCKGLDVESFNTLVERSAVQFAREDVDK